VSQLRYPGVLTATTTPFAPDGSVDLARVREHCTWQLDSGVLGVIPCGSLGEYEALTDPERAAVVRASVQAVGDRGVVVPGVSGKSAAEAVRWAEQARDAGCAGVMCLPPTSHAPSDDEVVAHFAAVTAVGLPVIAYNNPYSTRIDLTPPLLARLAEIDGIVAVKEFSQDVRRFAHIRELAPSLELLVGCDDLLAEAMLVGATGWIAGYSNALPELCVRLFALCRDGRWDHALPLYRAMLPALRWDALPRFVQAIKLAQEEVGRYGGLVRLPRLPLPEDAEAQARKDVRAALAEA
jgi:1-pyrroline-4-hydroxy-2-carboxylate deaminase